MSGELVDGNRIDPTLAAPAELQLAVDDPLADLADALALQQKVVVREVDRAVALVVQLLHLAQHVLRRAATPFAIGQSGDVAVDTPIGTAARGLHGAEPVQ